MVKVIKKTKKTKKTKKVSKKTLLNRQKKWWKMKVRKNWGNRCAVCGLSGEENKLDTHHIIYGASKWLEPQQGILLCSLHHRFSYSSAHKGSFIFYRWFSLNHPELSTFIFNLYNKNEENKIKELEDKNKLKQLKGVKS